MDNFTPEPEHFQEFTAKEVGLVINNLKKGKAPGLDSLDYRIWTHIFGFYPKFLTAIFNLCFRFNYFPRSLTNAKVVFLQKYGKIPELCNAYRPVCLLPTIGKILERLFHLRFIKHLDELNIIHDNQFGFMEGKSCEIAINNIVTRLKENKEIQHSALVSLDINSAFDSLDWSVLFRTLDSYGIAKCFRNFIFHYLVDRKVIFDDGLTRIERVCTMGCPQGSVIFPCLWNIYINPILNLNRERFLIQAFADD
ncbi:RNA-directed DNA polymerase from mobile element jockey [Araneus ventricosus]|uniref:RNA-directed DNA polymerase from mobile element jockey n=1 Tax=Araneus ventricosus TaxID=182803 RepID=A0A4Y2WK87_ARAVE|nr:RNA-directed DNA polymerase from mobile element jockey [Araneus ventricosus]